MTMLQEIERFNAANPVGATVRVRLDNGDEVLSKVTSPAEVLSGHTPVVWLEGIRGAYLLKRVKRA